MVLAQIGDHSVSGVQTIIQKELKYIVYADIVEDGNNNTTDHPDASVVVRA